MPKRLHKIFLGLCLCCGLLFAAASAAPAEIDRPALSADEIKAAYLFNFAKFVDWPAETFADTAAPLQICFFGGEAVERSFRTLEGKTVKGRALQVKTISRLQDLSRCQVLFIGADQLARWPQIQEQLTWGRMLTVSDGEGFSREGGMIGFSSQNNRIRFSIHLDKTQRSGLKLSSQLLQLAEVIRDPLPEGGE